MMVEREALSRAETITVAAIEESVPQLVEARDITDAFHVMLRKKAVSSLDAWLERARQSLVNSFARGMTRDIDAVRAAIASNWSNGQTEGQITKLKLVKRQMYGRATFRHYGADFALPKAVLHSDFFSGDDIERAASRPSGLLPPGRSPRTLCNSPAIARNQTGTENAARDHKPQ